MTIDSQKTAPRTPAPGDYLELARRHYENFPVGSWLLPRAARLHLHRIYAFARSADDLADEVRDAAMLASFRADFLAHVSGARRDVPLFEGLTATIAQCNLPVRLFLDLLDAFAQDLVVRRYDTDALYDYCRRSADPIGRLVLAVCGYRDERLDRLSDKICTALQLLNHLQDLRSDLIERDRIYFPGEDLERHGVAESMLRERVASPAVKALVLDWADRVAAQFAGGWGLIEGVSGRLRWELRAILRGAAAVLAAIRRRGGDVLDGKVRLPARTRVAIVLAGLCRRRAPEFFGAPP